MRLHRRNQSVARFRYGVDHLGVGAVISEGPAQLVDGIGQRLVADDDTWPKRFQKRRPADGFSGPRGEIQQQAGHPGFQPDPFTVTSQLV
jgi:hypothetical protein